MLKKIYETKELLATCSQEQLQQLANILQENLPEAEIVNNHDNTFMIKNNQENGTLTLEGLYQECSGPVKTWMDIYASNASIRPHYLFDIKPLGSDVCILKV